MVVGVLDMIPSDKYGMSSKDKQQGMGTDPWPFVSELICLARKKTTLVGYRVIWAK
jgi:hypothetical protein